LIHSVPYLPQLFILPLLHPSACLSCTLGETPPSMGDRSFLALLQFFYSYSRVPLQLPPSGSARHLLASTGDALKTIISRCDLKDSKRSVPIGGKHRLGLRTVGPLDAEGSWSCRSMVGPATKDEKSRSRP
jgi:hypothetical protein